MGKKQQLKNSVEMSKFSGFPHDLKNQK